MSSRGSRISQGSGVICHTKYKQPPFYPPGPLKVKSRELRKRLKYLEIGTSCTSLLGGSESEGFDVTTGNGNGIRHKVPSHYVQCQSYDPCGAPSLKLTPPFSHHKEVGTTDFNANADDANETCELEPESSDWRAEQERDPETGTCYLPAMPGEDIFEINGETPFTTLNVSQLPFMSGFWLKGPWNQGCRYEANAFTNGSNAFMNGGNAFPSGGNASTNGGNASTNGGNASTNGVNAFTSGANAFTNDAKAPPRRCHQCPYFENENSNCECPTDKCKQRDKCWWRARSLTNRRCHVIPLSKPDFAPSSFGYGQRKTLENINNVATETEAEACNSLTFPPGVLLCNCLRKAKSEKCCPCNKKPPQKPKKERQLSEFLSFQEEEDEYLRKIHKLYHPSEGASEEASEHEDANEEKTESGKIKCEEDEEGCHEDHEEEEEETFQSTLSHKSGSQKSPKSGSQKSSLKSASKSGSGSGSKQSKRTSHFSSDYGE